MGSKDKKRKIVSIVGARPQFIKASFVSKIIRQVGIEEILVHTGQHYDFQMSDVFFEELKLPKPDYYLGIGGESHGRMTGKMLIELEEVLKREKPDLVLVYGDTNSTLAGALASAKLYLPVGHVEAGLRSFRIDMPEEINRVLADRISILLFCPSHRAYENLKKEGAPHHLDRIVDGKKIKIKQRIFIVGDVMKDVFLMSSEFEKKPDVEIPERFILATVHREENADNPSNLLSIISAFDEISEKIKVVLPLHPRTKKRMDEFGISAKNLIILRPLSYFETLYMLKRCELVITDSGGLQKEAYFAGKKCVTLRRETEWGELVELGVNTLANPSDKNSIVHSVFRMKRKKSKFKLNLYGKGDASFKIADILRLFFEGKI